MSKRKKFKNQKRGYKKRKQREDFRPLEVTLEECNGDSTRLIKRFMKKVRKEEVLKPFYGKLMYYRTKSQIEREKRLKGTFFHKKRQRLEKELEKKIEKIDFE